ncbi:MAG: MoaD/ThiS family protein [Pseudomonadota bacterium]
MTITVKFFAGLRESLNLSHTEVGKESVETVLDVWNQTTGGAPIPDNTVCAINHEHHDFAHSVSDGDEIAFFPPVTGG